MKMLDTIKGLFNKNKSELNDCGYIGYARWFDYLIYCPAYDEEDFDGVHYGGIKGIREDAPDDVKKEFKEFMREYKKNRCIL